MLQWSTVTVMGTLSVKTSCARAFDLCIITTELKHAAEVSSNDMIHRHLVKYNILKLSSAEFATSEELQNCLVESIEPGIDRFLNVTKFGQSNYFP